MGKCWNICINLSYSTISIVLQDYNKVRDRDLTSDGDNDLWYHLHEKQRRTQRMRSTSIISMSVASSFQDLRTTQPKSRLGSIQEDDVFEAEGVRNRKQKHDLMRAKTEDMSHGKIIDVSGKDSWSPKRFSSQDKGDHSSSENNETHPLLELQTALTTAEVADSGVNDVREDSSQGLVTPSENGSSRGKLARQPKVVDTAPASPEPHPSFKASSVTSDSPNVMIDMKNLQSSNDSDDTDRDAAI